MEDVTQLDPRTRRRLRQAQDVAAQGKRSAAEQLYRDLVAETPDLIAAWLGLAEVTLDSAEKQTLYDHVLKLDPTNQAARQGKLSASSAEAESFDDVRAEIVAEARQREAEKEAALAALLEGTSLVEDKAADTVEAKVEHVHQPVAEASGLRCYRCNKPLDMKTAINNPGVGYICADCRREVEAPYFTATQFDYLIAAMVSLPLGLFAAFLMFTFIGGFGFFTYILYALMGPGIGTAIATLVLRLSGRRRGRYLPHLVGLCLVLSAVTVVLLIRFSLGGFILLALYSFFTISAAFYRLR